MMLFSQPRKGFTLIELLVVVAIIGILSSIVLAALGSARTRATDSKIKAELSNVRAQGELFYLAHNSSYSNGYPHPYVHNTESGCNSWYGGLFDSTQSENAFSLLKDAAYMSGGNQWGTAFCFIGANGASWTSIVALRGGNYWCVDSMGASKEITVSPWSLTGNSLCP